MNQTIKDIFDYRGWDHIKNLVHDWKHGHRADEGRTPGTAACRLTHVWVGEAQEALIAALEVLDEN